jgi:hypothetical protein
MKWLLQMTLHVLQLKVRTSGQVKNVEKNSI